MLEIVPESFVEGSVLAGAYRLDRVLGEGGMGVVWAAREVASGRDVAIKVLADDRAGDPTQQARILREAAATMTIDHPNIVKVAAVLETEVGVPFIVMERLEGESLRARLLCSTVLDVETCTWIFSGVLDAVAAAHAAGILHRDLKPENIFLSHDGGVKVLDFGIAKRMTRAAVESATSMSLTETGAVIGTPHYMAPEQIFADADVDARADVWSLGVILYECLAGKRPTEADGFGPILKRITSAKFDPLPPSVPPRLASLTMRMLARDRTARPPLDEVRRTLTNLDEPSPPSLARTAESAVPRRRRAFALAFVVVAAGAVALLARTRMHTRRDAPTSEPGAVPSVDQMTLALAASDHLAKRDGRACMHDLDTYDRLPSRTLPLSTDVRGGYAGTRSMCMMLVGDCAAGKKLYREWLPIHGPDMDAGLYDWAADSIVTMYCVPEP